ncbi:hypothetical protein VB712_13085 [Spirulina sp. CCNP1310]|uniref:hypothetical protein n=1 Tax=Spirulina sp. CCNP1310 TaxID=3110249 RepID=UPI002B1F1D25|nr:hypothetical protein [Spirulina sp. CCNP1310]MEA5420158.1 hypothetical protein [Spirulina sp. CCNP1310]
MDEVVRKVAALGLPGIILVVTMATTGLAGAAAITAALAFLGPGGMLGGIALLGVTGLITDALAKVGIEQLLLNIYQYRSQREGRSALLKEIDRLPISKDLARSLKESLFVIGL